MKRGVDVDKLVVHPAAAMFPMMTGKAFDDLVEDIRANRQLEPIMLDGNVLLDGRNRLAACKLLGVEPMFDLWDSRGGSQLQFIVSKNLRRRQMTEGQLAALADDLLPLLVEEAKQRMRDGGGDRVAPRGATRSIEAQEAEISGKATEIAAQAVGIGARSVQRYQEIKRKAPELIVDVKSGEMPLKRGAREAQLRVQRKAIGEYVVPAGMFNVIVADPPWPYDSRMEDDTHRGRVTYDVQTLDDICAWKDLVPAAPDSVLFMWATNYFLADGSASRVALAWGFQPKTIWTWRKLSKDGEQKMGLGHWGRNVTEHVIVAVKGRPQGFNFKTVQTCFDGPARQHSRKPDEFYAFVESVAPDARRVELHSRQRRAGWVTSGAEVDKFEASTRDSMIRAGARRGEIDA